MAPAKTKRLWVVEELKDGTWELVADFKAYRRKLDAQQAMTEDALFDEYTPQVRDYRIASFIREEAKR